VSTTRKVRPEARLLNLPEEQQSQLAEWLLSGMPYHAAKTAVAKEFGVTCSLASLSRFYAEVCVPVLLRRRSQAVAAADEVAAAAQSTPGRFDAATIDALRQKAFELAVSPLASAKDIKSVTMLLLKNGDQELKRQELDLQRAKFRRETAEMFLDYYEDRRAKEVVTSTAPRAQKIEELGKVMFPGLWEERGR
jgi:hypothetical protein